MKTKNVVRSLACAVLVWGGAPGVEARSLAKQIDEFFGPSGILLDAGGSPGGEPLPPTQFSSSSLATLGLLVKMLSSNAVEVPAISTAPGLTFRYDPDTQLFERSTTSLGPVFVERAQTMGRQKFALGLSYLFVDFDEWKGDNLDRLTFALQPSPNGPVGNATATVNFDRFTLRSHFVSFFATYGITDRWDGSVLLPLVFTSWKARARARVDTPVTGARISARTFSGSDDKAGVGDLLLRTKYRLLDSELFNFSVGSSLRIPTGNEDNFQGTGDTIFGPFLALSRGFSRCDVHASTEIDINIVDSDRSRIHYAGGVTIRAMEQLAFLIDLIGNSNITTDRVSRRVPQFAAVASQTPSASPLTPSGFTRVSRNLSTNIVDLAVGLKGNVGPLTGFITFFVPLNNDGLRADWIPTAGLEWHF